MDNERRISRRGLLGAGLGAGAGLALAGCGPDGTPGGGNSGSAGNPTSGAGGGSVRPTYIPFDGPKPDLVGDGTTGVPNGFLSYPDPPPSTGTLPLGLSAPVEFMVQGLASPTPPSRNEWWKQFEADLGTTITINPVDSTQYTAKFQAAIAGGTLGEVTQIVKVPQLPAVLESMFTDLTPYLSGDNIKKYPNLASTPSAAWDMCTVNGKLWGMTNPRIVGGVVLMTRGDLLEEKGISRMPELNSGEDFLDLCRELTDRDAGTFAIGQMPQDWTIPLIMEALGGPNGWRVESDGSWTSAYESPEFAQALEIVTQMWDEGLFHPNTFTDLSSTGVWFRAGATNLFAQNFAAWQLYASNYDFQTGLVLMPKWNGGGKAEKHLGVPGYADPVGIRKTDDENRIDELLRVADYLASPFGTEEYLKIKYGVRDRQYTLEDGQVALIPDAPKETFVPTYYGGQTAVDLYIPGRSELTTEIFHYCQDMFPTGVANPEYGKFSDANVSKAPAANRVLRDLMGDIIQGRATMTQWETGVKTWKQQAGDAMAREFADQ